MIDNVQCPVGISPTKRNKQVARMGLLLSGVSDYVKWVPGFRFVTTRVWYYPDRVGPVH